MSNPQTLGKICSSCREWRPADQFLWRMGRPTSQCKKCRTASQVRSRQARMVKDLEPGEGIRREPLMFWPEGLDLRKKEEGGDT